MKKYALYLFMTLCFLRAADLPEEKQRPRSITDAALL
jgi:hypothetical protein